MALLVSAAVTDYLLASLYTILFIIAVIQLLRNQLLSKEEGWTQRKLFHGFISGANFFRSLFFFFQPSIHAHSIKFPSDLDFLFNSLPGALYFSTFLLFVFFWAEFYHYAHDKNVPSLQKLRPTFLYVNLGVYSIVFLLILVLFFVPADAKNGIKVAVTLFLAILSFGASFSFLIYGGRLLMIFTKFPIESKRRKSLLNKVGSVTVVCTIDFLARAIIIIWGAINWHIRISYIATLFYYLLLEVFPLCLMLWLLRKVPKKGYQALEQQESSRSKKHEMAAPVISTDGGEF